jgi:hypothetical protein
MKLRIIMVGIPILIIACIRQKLPKQRDDYAHLGEFERWEEHVVIIANLREKRRSRKPRLKAVGIRCGDHSTPSTRKGWH